MQTDSIKVNKPADSWLGQDKAKHFLLSAMITGAVSYYEIHEQNKTRQSGQTMGAGIALSLGLGKEFWDWKRSNGFFSWKDLVVDVLGVAIGLGVLSQW